MSTTPTKAALSAADVSVGYGDIELLAGLSMNLQPGSVTALVGPNGAGKTTIVRALTGLRPQQSGKVTWFGQPSLSPELRQRIGVVWQDRGLPASVSSKRWIPHIASLYGVSADAELIQRLGLPLINRGMRYLSGGEQQRIALFGAFNHRPDLLILDEPTVGLDDSARQTFYDLINEHVQRGAAVLMTSHYAQDVAVLAHSIIDIGTDKSTDSAALFSTSGVLDIFQASRLLPPGYQLLSSTNGYRLKGSGAADLLALAARIADDQGFQILAFAVVGSDEQ